MHRLCRVHWRYSGVDVSLPSFKHKQHLRFYILAYLPSLRTCTIFTRTLARHGCNWVSASTFCLCVFSEAYRFAVRCFFCPSETAVFAFCHSYVLQPLWQAASDVFPALRPRLEQLRANAATYDAIVNPEAPSAAVSQVSSPGDEGSVTLRVDSSDCDDS